MVIFALNHISKQYLNQPKNAFISTGKKLLVYPYQKSVDTREQEQSTPTACELKQTTSIPREQEQSTLCSREQEQTTLCPRELEQTTSTACELKQTTLYPHEQEQTTSCPREQEQSTSCPREQEQSTSIPRELEQTTSIPRELEQTTSIPCEQEQTTSCPREQEQSTSCKTGEKPASEIEEKAKRILPSFYPPDVGRKLVLDNVDIHQITHDMTEHHQNPDAHFCTLMATENRVSGNHLADDQPTCSLLDMENGKCCPNQYEHKLQRDNYVQLVSRVITQELPCLRFLSEVAVNHIIHQYSSNMKQATETVSY